MKGKLYTTYLLLFLSSIISLRCSTPSKARSAASNEQIVFFDDFSGERLDTSKWTIQVTRTNVVNNELQAYVDSAATIYFVRGDQAEGASNGALVLQPHYAPGYTTKEGKKFDFISGRIDSRNKAEFMYGTFSARVKVTDGSGLWPAWWMLGKGRWPESGEIDIMEYIGEKDWVSSAVHGPGYSGETPFVDRLYFENNNDATQWHIYTVEWGPDTLLFKYDDVSVFRVTRPMVEHFGKWVFDNSKYLILNFAVGGGYPVKINGVKEPYFGLPPATAELIKSKKGKMLVDWVKVTKR